MISTTKPRSAKLVTAIEIVTQTGRGIADDPVRTVTQYWSLKGRLLAERDEYRQEKEHRP